jgi:hypothetical protein
MTTHVSISGCLYKLTCRQPIKLSELPRSNVFIGYGRLVTPNCNYADKPVVALYQFHDRGGKIARVTIE